MGRLRLGLVVALVVLAGCTGNVALSEDTESTSTGSVSDAGPTPVPTAESFRGTVINVVDGDTVDVRLEDGTEERIRLLGVDTPEVRGETDPADFPGVPDSTQGEECLRDAGVEASEFARSRLLGEAVQVVFDDQSDRRGGFGRLLAYIFVDDANFNYQLVTQGHAGVYETQFTYLEQFEAAADDARTENIGLWRCRTPGTEVGQSTSTTESDLVVGEIHEDAAGNDNENLNDEYVVFENTGDDPLDLTGWSLRDEAGHGYTFPDGFVLDAGARVTVYTGSGKDTATALYWGATGAVWNNGGDTVIVENQDGTVVIEREYA